MKGRTGALDKVSLVNLSLGGAMIEHPGVVDPESMSFLSLELQQQTFSLRCRIVWSKVERHEVDPEGKAANIFRTGLEFLDPPEEVQGVIDEYIQLLIE
jgi:hypothetical protein